MEINAVVRGQETAATAQKEVSSVQKTPEVQKDAAQEVAPKDETTDASREQTERLVLDLNEAIGPLNTNISFGFNDDVDEMYIAVREKDTGEVIRQVPSQEAMELMAKMREVVGIIFDSKG